MREGLGSKASTTHQHLVFDVVLTSKEATDGDVNRDGIAGERMQASGVEGGFEADVGGREGGPMPVTAALRGGGRGG